MRTTGESTVIELIKLEASGLNLEEKPIPIAAQVRMPGEQAIELDMEGAIRVNQQTQQLSSRCNCRYRYAAQPRSP